MTPKEAFEIKRIKKLTGHTAHSFNDILKRELKSKTFREEYYKEVARLELAGQIRKLRTAKKLTQKQIAEKANMPQSVIARLESGTHSISVDTLSRVARVLGKQIRLA